MKRIGWVSWAKAFEWRGWLKRLDWAIFVLVAIGASALGLVATYGGSFSERAALMTAIFSATAAAFSALAAYRSISIAQALDVVNLHVASKIRTDVPPGFHTTSIEAKRAWVEVAITNNSRRPVTISSIGVRETGRLLGGFITEYEKLSADVPLPRLLGVAEPFVATIPLSLADAKDAARKNVRVSLVTGERFYSKPMEAGIGLS